MAIKTKKFDIASHLETEEDIKLFLEEMGATGNSSDLIHAVNIASRAKGVANIANKTGVTRASLYKSLSKDGNPRFDTIYNIVKAMGCRIIIAPSI
ncbi:MAG: putative addiction module antidote protein [Desulfobacteraceae bacterium 4572_130]|nr:MAG: putative addiction module antidote protein [Desulfobacteraceae bacterium 4572_130]